MPRRRFDFSISGWNGVNDTAPQATREPTLLRLARNMMPDGVFGGVWCTRPGFGDPHSIAGNTYGRGIQQFTKQDGSERACFFMGSNVYVSVNGATAASVPLTGVSIAAGTPSTPSKYLLGTGVFGDRLVVSDTTSAPWVWDGTTFTSLTNAPVARGRPTTYYGKLFFIKNANPVTIAWSEEGDPTTGYEAGGYNNAWDLTQTSNEAVTAILGTNDALYYWKETSFDMIRGAVDDEFSTSGTVAGISADTGTLSPHAVVNAGGCIWFLDQRGRPQRYAGGGSVEPVWEAAQQTLQFADTANLAMASAAHFAEAGVVAFLVPSVLVPVSGIANMMLAFDDGTGAFLGTWDDASSLDDYAIATMDAHVVGSVKMGDTVRIAHLGGIICRTWIWHLPGSNDDNSALEYYADRGGHGASQPIVSHFIPGPLGESADHKVYDRIIVSLAGGNTLTNLQIAYTTAEGSAPPAQTMNVTGRNEVGAISPVFVPQAEQRVQVGTLARTRWLQPRVSHATVAEILSVNRVSVRGSYDSADPYGI